MKKVLIGVVILGLFTAYVLCYRTYAEERKLTLATENAIILFMHSEVKVKQPPSGQWLDATEGMMLSGGDELKTGADSWVEIGLGEGYENVARIQELTFVELTDLAPVKINIFKGELRALVEKLSEYETFEIQTPTSVSAVRGTGWDTNTDGKKVIVDTFEGEVYFAAVSKEGDLLEDPIIKSGKRGILEDPKKPIKIKDLPRGKMLNWNKWKEDFMKRRGKGKTLGEKTKQKQQITSNMLKGKQDILEDRDQDLIEKRVESDRGSDGGGAYP